MTEHELYVNNNGKLIPSSEYSISSGNRGYSYGDGLFETIRVINGKVTNFENHFSRLTEGAKALKMRLPSFMTQDFLLQQMSELIAACKITEGARIRLSIFVSRHQKE
jgi:branched-chain amino acid aminotransferase